MKYSKRFKDMIKRLVRRHPDAIQVQFRSRDIYRSLEDRGMCAMPSPNRAVATQKAIDMVREWEGSLHPD